MGPRIEIVEPTEEERRTIFNELRPRSSTLLIEQQVIVTLIEQCIRAVAAQGPGTIDCDVNPMFQHAYQRSAVRALELAHGEVLNWYDRLNRGFAPVLPKEPPADPEKQE